VGGTAVAPTNGNLWGKPPPQQNTSEAKFQPTEGEGERKKELEKKSKRKLGEEFKDGEDGQSGGLSNKSGVVKGKRGWSGGWP